MPTPTSTARAGGLALALVATLGCPGKREAEPTKASPTQLAPTQDQPEPEHHLIRYACQGFDRAVAAGAPKDRLLSHSAKHAVELGGARVEQATQRWALLPPQRLLELIDRYERETAADPTGCQGLRAHLDQMAERDAAR